MKRRPHIRALTAEAVATILGVHRVTVLRWRKEGLFGPPGPLTPASLADFLRTHTDWRGRIASR